MKYFQVFVDEDTRDKRIRGLKDTRDTAADATAQTTLTKNEDPKIHHSKGQGWATFFRFC